MMSLTSLLMILKMANETRVADIEEFGPRGGIVFKPMKTVLFYASYSEVSFLGRVNNSKLWKTSLRLLTQTNLKILKLVTNMMTEIQYFLSLILNLSRRAFRKS